MTEIRKVGNFETRAGEQLLYWTILDLHRSITYFLAEEKQAHIDGYELEQFTAAIALLALLGERYRFSIGVQAATVRRWREVYFTLYDKLDAPSDDVPDPLRANILAAFAQLEAVTQLRPPSRWGL